MRMRKRTPSRTKGKQHRRTRMQPLELGVSTLRCGQNHSLFLSLTSHSSFTPVHASHQMTASMLSIDLVSIHSCLHALS